MGGIHRTSSDRQTQKSREVQPKMDIFREKAKSGSRGSKRYMLVQSRR